jgi:hypothetical protein
MYTSESNVEHSLEKGNIMSKTAKPPSKPKPAPKPLRKILGMRPTR